MWGKVKAARPMKVRRKIESEKLSPCINKNKAKTPINQLKEVKNKNILYIDLSVCLFF